MPTVSNYRVRAALGAPRTEALWLVFVLLVIQKMTNNPNFTSPGTYVTALAAAAAAYQAALKTMGTTKDVSDARTAAKQAVNDALAHLKDYINSVVETLPTDQGKAAIQSTGLSTRSKARTSSPRSRPSTAASPAPSCSSPSPPPRAAMYFFEFSADGKTWSACPNVMKCKTSLSGLTVGTTYYFRVHAQTRKGSPTSPRSSPSSSADPARSPRAAGEFLEGPSHLAPDARALRVDLCFGEARHAGNIVCVQALHEHQIEEFGALLVEACLHRR